MARRTKDIIIPGDDPENRDKGKVYVITEMPASRAEKWAARSLMAIARAGIDLPRDIMRSGMMGLAVVGANQLAAASWPEVEGLMDEMMSCVQIRPPSGVLRALNEDFGDIEEVSTRFTLRRAVLELHLGFSLADGLSRWLPAMQTTTSEGSKSTPTSPDQSGPS